MQMTLDTPGYTEDAIFEGKVHKKPMSLPHAVKIFVNSNSDFPVGSCGGGVTPTQSTVNRLKESLLRIELSVSPSISLHPLLPSLPFDYCHPRDLSSI